MFWTTAAYAMAPAGGGAPGGGESFLTGGLVPLILMFAVFYFLLIRPQQKKAKEQKAMLAALKRGDEVVTAGGIYGRITEVADDYVILDLGKAEIKVMRAAVSGLAGASRPVLDKKGKGKDAKSGDTQPPADKK